MHTHVLHHFLLVQTVKYTSSVWNRPQCVHTSGHHLILLPPCTPATHSLTKLECVYTSHLLSY